MASPIPIKNLYYLLCYAWDQLEQGELVDINRLPLTELVDLFALVLCEGIERQARRGLEQGYKTKTDQIAGIRGRIDLLTTVRRLLPLHGHAECTFDELSVDTAANRILKSTLAVLRRTPELNRDLRARIYGCERGLRGVKVAPLTRALFQSVQLHSNNRFYKFLLNVCALIHDASLIDENDGRARFRDFVRDQDRMAIVFQKFLLNFIRRECPEWVAKSEMISWDFSSTTDPLGRLLPRMQTDISLSRPGEHLIIDAKFYTNTLSGHYNVDKIHSSNLYQIVSYLMNHDREGEDRIRGMLLYPRVDQTLRETYTILGHEVSVFTIDLHQAWQNIAYEIMEIVRPTELHVAATM